MCLVVKIKICTLHGSYSFISLLLRDCWLQLPGLQRNVKKIKCLLPHWDPASSVLFYCCVSADANAESDWHESMFYDSQSQNDHTMMKNDDWWRWYQRWMMNDEGWIWWMVVIHVSLWPAWRHLSQALIVALTVISLGRFERLGADHELQHETHSLRSFRFITYSWFISIHFDSFRFICALWFRIKCGYWSYSVTDQHFMRFQHLIVSSTLHGTSTSSPEDARLAAIADLKSVKNLWQRSKIQSAFVWMVWDGLGWSGMVWSSATSCFEFVMLLSKNPQMTNQWLAYIQYCFK